MTRINAPKNVGIRTNGTNGTNGTNATNRTNKMMLLAGILLVLVLIILSMFTNIQASTIGLILFIVLGTFFGIPFYVSLPLGLLLYFFVL
jgi:uncharacterized membrane-anchored protein